MKKFYFIIVALILATPTLLPAAKGKIKDLYPPGNSKVTSNFTKPNIIGPGGVQVNSFTGNMFHQRNDLLIPGRGLDLEVTFSYNSGQTKNNWGYGYGWTTNFNMMYERKPGAVVVRREDGRKDVFVHSSGYTAPPGIFDELSEYETGKFLLRTKYGMKYFFDDSACKKVTSDEDPNGNMRTYHYTDCFPMKITSPSGQAITFAWESGRLVQVRDSIAFPPRTTSYEYDARGNMVRVTDPLGHSASFPYDGAGNRLSHTDFQAYRREVS